MAPNDFSPTFKPAFFQPFQTKFKNGPKRTSSKFEKSTSLNSNSKTFDATKYHFLIDKIVKSNGSKLSDEKSRSICSQIQNIKTLDHLYIYLNSIFSSEKMLKECNRLSPSILQTLLGKDICPWEMKKYLFKLAPKDCKNLQVYHSYILAADKANDLLSIRESFQTIKLLNSFEIKTYSIFIKVIARQGYVTEAKNAFLEAKKLGLLDSKVYNNYLNILAKHANFEEIQALFNEALANGHADVNLYNSYIHIAGKHKMYVQAKSAFQYLKDCGQTDKFSYTSFMNAAGHQMEFDDLKIAFEEALEYGHYDDKTFNSYIDLAGKNKQFDESLRTFEEIKKRKLHSVVTYVNFIFAAFYNKHPLNGIKAYNEARALYPVEVNIIDCLIKAAGENNAYQLAYSTFKNALSLKIAKTSTFEMLIYIAGKNKKFSDLKEVFDYAVNRKFAGIATYTRYIDAAAACGEFAECQKTFNQMKDLNLLDTIAISRYIRAAAQMGTFRDVESAYSDAKKKNIIDNLLICDYIEAAALHKQSQSAKTTFLEAVKKGTADAYTYNTFLKIAEWDEAILLFNQMVTQKIANIVSYNIMIDIAGAMKRYDFAQTLFQTAKEKKWANEITYCAFIKVAGAFQKLKDIKETFKEALENGFNGTILYNCYIYNIGKSHDLEAVQAAYDSARILKKADAFTYSTYIDIMGENSYFENALKAFQEAETECFCDIKLYTCALEALRKNGKIQEAHTLFEKIKQLDIADSQFYTCYVLCHPSKAQELLQEAKHKKIASEGLFNAVIGVEGSKGDYEAVKNIFHDAKKNRSAGKITYLTFIDNAGKLNQFEDATQAFQEAMKLEFNDVAIFNSYMNAAVIANRYRVITETFEKIRKNIADSISFTIFINAASKMGKFSDAKKAFYEFKKFNIHDPVIYMNYLVAAVRAEEVEEVKIVFNEIKTLGIATSRIYSIYLSFLGGVAEKLRLSNFEIHKVLSFEEVKNIYLEIENLGLNNPEIFTHYIQNVCRFGQFQEADRVLNETERQKDSDHIAKNIFLNWKLKSVLSEEIKEKITFPENTSDPLYALLSSSYRLFLRISTKQKNSFVAQTRVPHSSFELDQKLNQDIHLIAKTVNESVLVKLQSLLKSIRDVASVEHSIKYIRLTGGAVAWCLEANFFQDCFERMAGQTNNPCLDSNHMPLFNALFTERFSSPLKDWDFKILLDSNDPQRIACISDQLIKDLSFKAILKPETVKQIFFHKQSFICDEDNLYSLRRLMDHQKTSYDIAIGGYYARSNLFHSDALQISLEGVLEDSKASNFLIATEGSIEEAAIDYFLKRLRASTPETINKYGCATYIARRAQGYYGVDKPLELHVCHTLARLPPEESLKLLIQARENHGESAEMGLAMLFHVCSILSDNNYFKEAEDLRSNSELLWNSASVHPFFKSLSQLWIKEKRPFMEIKAALEMVGILGLISCKNPEMICKLEENNNKQIIEFTINGAYFSVPLDPENTFIAFAQTAYVHSLEHLVKTLTPSGGFHFDPSSTELIAKLLGLSEKQLERLITKWMNPLKTIQKKQRRRRKKKPVKEEKAVQLNEIPPSDKSFWSWAYSWFYNPK